MRIIKSAVTLASTTLVSRLLGYLRDVLLASQLGTGPFNDAFIAATKLTNLFRSLFAEGALNNAFAPMFCAALSSSKPETARVIAARVQSFLLSVLIIFFLVAMWQMPMLVHITTPGFRTNTLLYHLTVELGRINFPYLPLISLAAFYGAILNSLGRFFAYAATSIILNIVLVSSSIIAIYYRVPPETFVYYISYATVAAGAIELIWMILWLRVYPIPLQLPKIEKYTKLFCYKIIPSLAGVGVYQLSICIDLIILSFMPHAISYLYYADRLTQLPLALIGTAISTVLLPAISRAVKLREQDKLVKMYCTSSCLVLALAIPASCGLLILGEEILAAIFGYGSFNAQSISGTYRNLSVLSLALPAFVLQKVYLAQIYGAGDTKTPVKISALALICNTALSLLLIQRYDYLGVTIATTIASWISVFIFTRHLRRIKNLRYDRVTYNEITIYCLASAVMSGILYYLPKWWLGFTHVSSSSILLLFIKIALAMMVYAVALVIGKSRIREFVRGL